MAAVFPTELVKEFVVSSHFNLGKVKALYEQYPALLTVQHDWGNNDLEDGLHAASHVGNRPIAEFFLDEGVPLTICSAAMLGRLDDVQAFIERDASQANARGAHGIPVLYHASMSGDIRIADLLRDFGCTEGYSFALHGAVNYGHQAMVAWLLNNGATQLEMKDYQGQTPLQRATEANLNDIVNLLRKAGATQ
ncbi:MAG: ankyrin repeat domain-containing protein [Anaerolineae bacterium]|nr:ankyrin repeat domain-containing protein [Anaerolineae bacterium]